MKSIHLTNNIIDDPDIPIGLKSYRSDTECLFQYTREIF